MKILSGKLNLFHVYRETRERAVLMCVLQGCEHE
jgi:hypothetical protein